MSGGRKSNAVTTQPVAVLQCVLQGAVFPFCSTSHVYSPPARRPMRAAHAAEKPRGRLGLGARATGLGSAAPAATKARPQITDDRSGRDSYAYPRASLRCFAQLHLPPWVRWAGPPRGQCRPVDVVLRTRLRCAPRPQDRRRSRGGQIVVTHGSMYGSRSLEVLLSRGVDRPECRIRMPEQVTRLLLLPAYY